MENPLGQAHTVANAASRSLRGMKLGSLDVNDTVCLPSGLSFRSSIHSTCSKEYEDRSMGFQRGNDRVNERDVEGSRSTGPMNSGRLTPEGNGRDIGGSQISKLMDLGRSLENRRGMGGSQFTRSMDFGRGNTQEGGRNVGGFQPTRSMDFGRVQGNGRDMGGSQFNRSADFGRGNIQGNGRNMWGSQANKSVNFLTGILQQNSRDTGASQFTHYTVEKDADIVHVKLIRNNAFVTITDSKGNKKVGASSGCLSTKVSRYAAEATAEHVGRLAKNMGLKSFVVKVNGFTHFKKKKQAILSFRDGFTNSRSDQNPIVYIEDTTRRAHNGCRLRKKRRV